MTAGDDDFHAAAFYVTRRERSKLLEHGPAVLAECIRFFAIQPRLVQTWGDWREPKRKSQAPSCGPGARSKGRTG